MQHALRCISAESGASCRMSREPLRHLCMCDTAPPPCPKDITPATATTSASQKNPPPATLAHTRTSPVGSRRGLGSVLALARHSGEALLGRGSECVAGVRGWVDGFRVQVSRFGGRYLASIQGLGGSLRRSGQRGRTWSLQTLNLYPNPSFALAKSPWILRYMADSAAL